MLEVLASLITLYITNLLLSAKIPESANRDF